MPERTIFSPILAEILYLWLAGKSIIFIKVLPLIIESLEILFMFSP